eukprot:CAMPEP_0185757078 /NCGR_PEP_ID=MMETSP1174-20130828/15509_1 /TAXON_ID=35687 /ORGANISM="Dictyocha speculum, Strain CCMP1381" /LENGTH=405 /DNA_ID=CAMNT_0028436339 /DNA_START=18 /DNA_END=1235 /DNA_ORIENTATION=-
MMLVHVVTTLGLLQSANALIPFHNRLRVQRKVQMSAEPHATVVFLRHGQSVWNEASLFTGWADVELTTLGKNEAAKGATQMWQEGLKIDVAYTSLLKRAQQTLDIALTITGQEDVPVHYDWRLNERMYGGLTGLNKKETAEKYGPEQVKLWRRSYDIPPPEIKKDSPYWPGNDNKYAHIDEADIPLSECLKDTVDRCLPYWEGEIVPALQRGKTVLVAAHGNSIRGMVKYLDNIHEDAITDLEIPTAVPLVYHLDANLQPMKNERAVAPLSGYFLVDPEELAKLQAAVAAQSVVTESSSAPTSGDREWDDVKMDGGDESVRFACFGSGCLMLSNEQTEAAFNSKTFDGQVAMWQFEEIVADLAGEDGVGWTKEETEQIFALVDRNSDGLIDFGEFVQAITAEKVE